MTPNTRPPWFTVVASLIPGIGLVVLGLVLLAVKERDLRQELAADVRTAAADAATHLERLLNEEVAGLGARLTEPPREPHHAERAFRFDLIRATPAQPWAVVGAPPPTRAVAEGEPSAGVLDLSGFVKDIERREYVEGDAAGAAARYRDLALNPSCGPADRVRFRFAEAGARQHAGQVSRAVAVLGELLAEAPKDGAVDGIPVQFSAELQRIELLAQQGEEVAADARQFWSRLQSGDVPLPAGEVASHLREARARLQPWLAEEDVTALDLAQLAQLESLAATLTGIEGGTVQRSSLEGSPDAPRTAEPQVLLVQVSDDARRLTALLLPAHALLPEPGRDAIPVQILGAEPPERSPGDTVQSLGDLEPLRLHATTPPDRLRRMLNPWRVAVFSGLAMVVLMSAAGAIVSHRTVTRRLQLAQIRSDLVASISHELRTPLTAILLNLELLEDPRTDDEFRRTNARRARLSAERLQRLVDRVLQFTRAENLAADAVATALDPRELLQAATEEMHEALRDTTVRVEVEPDAPPALLDRDAAVQVLTGLLENAAKYAGEHSHITLRARAGDSNRLRLEVEDDGPGVPADEREHLFEAFYRGPRSAGEQRGVGLGLAIARRVIEAQGGTIHAEPARPGTERPGLRIVLEVPAAPTLPATAERDPREASIHAPPTPGEPGR